MLESEYRRVLLALAAIVVLAFGLRVYFATEVIDEPLPDSIGYSRIAESLYAEHQFGPDDLERRDTYSPGLPLFVSGIYYLTGGVNPLAARLVIALLGAATALIAYLIGRRIAGPAWGLVAALPVAVYPALLEYHGMFMTEPLAAFTFSAAILGLLWAADKPGSLPYTVPGVLLGATAMVRPEYLLIGAALVLAAAWQRRRQRLAVAALMLMAFALPILPWTIRNAITLDRFVPISAGGGQALFIGSYMPGYEGPNADLHTRVLSDLRREDPGLERAVRRRFPDHPAERPIILGQALEVIAARRRPDLTADAALTRLGRERLWDNLTERPLAYLGTVADKLWTMWRSGPYSGNHPVMSRAPWIALHGVLVLLALAGLVALAVKRRWEGVLLVIPLLGVTMIAAVLLASPRRTLVLVPVLGALAAAGTAWLWERARAESAAS
jgi:dolichyl-phosphate-mannose-protein mannosyltransferase